MQSISLTFLPINNIILNISFICPTLKQKNIDFLACSKFYALAVFDITVMLYSSFLKFASKKSLCYGVINFKNILSCFLENRQAN